ncbi:MAG: ParA family protein [Fibrobacteres bacterium]|nr:ParA family protein [Fibrobacterota bacterium]
MTKSFCFLSKKGGVGKTTFSLNCAHALAFSKFRTLLVDMDGQANLTRHLLKGAAGMEGVPGEPAKAPLPGSAVPAGFPDISQVLLRRCAPHEAILTTGYENLDLLAGSTSLDDLPILDARLIREPARFKLILQELAPDYDFILVDCPPIVNWLTRMVLFAVEGVIVPIQAEPYALQGLQDLIPMLDKMSATAQLYKIVINMYRANTQLHQNILKEIAEEFPGRIARQTVRQTIQLAEAAREGLSIFEYAPASIGALDLYALCWELFELSPDKVKLNVQARAEKAAPEAVTAPLAEENPV